MILWIKIMGVKQRIRRLWDTDDRPKTRNLEERNEQNEETTVKFTKNSKRLGFTLAWDGSRRHF